VATHAGIKPGVHVHGLKRIEEADDQARCDAKVHEIAAQPWLQLSPIVPAAFYYFTHRPQSITWLAALSI